MPSLFDELCAKLAQDPRLTRRGGPRVDLSVLLFNARDDLRALWVAAEGQSPSELAEAVERLRPIFGDRLASSLPRAGK